MTKLRVGSSGPIAKPSDFGAVTTVAPQVLGTVGGPDGAVGWLPIGQTAGTVAAGNDPRFAAAGLPLKSVTLEPNTGIVSLETEAGTNALPLAIPESCILRASADLMVSGAQGLRVGNVIVSCTGKRIAAGGLSVGASSYGAGVDLVTPAMAPTFVAVGNELQLQLTTDDLYPLVVRGRVEISVQSTANDPTPPITIWQQLVYDLQAVNGSNLRGIFLPVDMVVDGGNVIEIPARDLVGVKLANATVNRFAATTYGDFPAVGPGALSEFKSLANSDAIEYKSLLVVTEGHSNVGVDAYEQACKAVLRDNQTANFYVAGRTMYLDGTAATVMPVAGLHIIQGDMDVAQTAMECGGLPSVASRIWNGRTLCWLRFLEHPTAGERAATKAILQPFFGTA